MLDLPTTVTLRDCRSGQTMTARFVRLSRDLAQTRVDAHWWSGLGISKKVRENEGDHHWRWTKIVGSLKNDAFAECQAIQTDDEEIQGAIVYRVDGKSLLEPNSGAVHGEFLATAPRNRDWLVTNPHFRGAGVGLLTFAIAHSYMLGLGGRINLYSLPTPATEQWYTKLGFVATGDLEDGMMLFELPAEKAEGVLKTKGLL